MQVFQSDVSSTQSEGMFAPAAKPRRKNDGAPIPPQQACPLRIAEGALFFWPFLPLKPSAWRRLFPKRKPRTLVRGLLGGWLMGFEPTTLGTTNRCSNQLSYSHHVPSFGPRVVLKGAQRYSRCLNVKPFPWGLLSTFEA